jgi:hypothetical protein
MLAFHVLALACVLVSTAQDVVDTSDPRTADAQEELATLRGMLQTWVERPGWPQVPREDDTGRSALPHDPCPEISVRLAAFEDRFGRRPQDLPGYDELSTLAGVVHARLLEQYPVPSPEVHVLNSNWFDPGWVGARALLLDVSGQQSEARELLFGTGRRSWDGCDPYCLSEDLYYLCRSRAELLDRAGDDAEALGWYLETLHWTLLDECADCFGRPRLGAPLVMARLVALLESAGDEQAASAACRRLNQAENTLWGFSDGLVPRGCDDPGPGPVVFSITLDGEDTWDPDHTAMVVGEREAPATWRVLSCRVPRYRDHQELRRFVPHYGSDLDVARPPDPRIAGRIAEALESLRNGRDPADLIIPSF